VTPSADDTVGRIESSDSPVRYIVDGDRRRWTVREIASNRYDRRDSRDLVFMARDIVRRVRNYPAEWYALEDDALYALSLGA
jgi:hypothetical protein